MSECEMDSYVIFYVVKGDVKVKVNEEVNKISEDQCIIIDPATVSMESEDGVKLMGIQISKQS